jgi:hypothetical protein
VRELEIDVDDVDGVNEALEIDEADESDDEERVIVGEDEDFCVWRGAGGVAGRESEVGVGDSVMRRQLTLGEEEGEEPPERSLEPDPLFFRNNENKFF